MTTNEKMQRVTRSCSCDVGSREDNPNLPPGFCAMCEECGLPGHKCYHPHQHPKVVALCDACYLKTRHAPGAREPNAYFFAESEWFFDDDERWSVERPSRDGMLYWIGRVTRPGDCLKITFESGIGTDFVRREDASLEVSFGDAARKVWGSGAVSLELARDVIRAAAAGDDLREVFARADAQIHYFT